ncbi:MAG: alpha/beta hydrolase [Candidatus Peribacteraceae bacterium]
MDTANVNIIFLHGNNGGQDEGGKGSDYWFPSAQKEFEKRGLRAVAKDFPDPKIAHMNIWLPFLKEECGANEHSILIGHSSGAIAAMRYAEKNKILGSVLVGAYYTDTGDEYERMSGYFDEKWNWPSIRKNQQWIIQFASTDDPFFPIEEPRFVSKQLQTQYHEFTERGHFFDCEFPELVEEVMQKLA